jgi:hypothetical protein
MKKTATDWLYERFLFAGYAAPAEWKEKAKEMEREQMIEVSKAGCFSKFEFEQYYKETYGKDA